MNRVSILKIFKRLITVIIILGLLFVHFVIPRVLTEKKSAMKSFFKGDPAYEYDHIFNDSSTYKRKKLSITTYDGLQLSAYLTYSNLDVTKGTIILLPRSDNTKYDFLDISSVLAFDGFNSVALDFRAYGESEGKFTTYGAKEKEDIKTVVDHLINKEGLNNFGIWGQSLGAAVALEAMAIDQRIKYGIIESTYTDYRTNMRTYFARVAGFEFNTFVDYLVNRSGTIGGFNPDEASPILAAEKVTQPILMAHGSKDMVFNIKYGKSVFSKLKSTEKEFVEIPSAAHINVWEAGGDDYFKKAFDFLNKHSQ